MNRLLLGMVTSFAVVALAACASHPVQEEVATAQEEAERTIPISISVENPPQQAADIQEQEERPDTQAAEIEVQEVTEDVPQEEEIYFDEVEETVYVVSTVNVRESYSIESDKLGSLDTNASIVRIGIGRQGTPAEGWSLVEYGDDIAYIKSSYLSLSMQSAQTVTTAAPTQTTTPTPSPAPATPAPAPTTPNTSVEQPYEGVHIATDEEIDFWVNSPRPEDPGWKHWRGSAQQYEIVEQ